MKDQGIEFALRVADQGQLILAIEEIEAGRVKQIVTCEGIEFSDDPELNARIHAYIKSIGGQVVLVQIKGDQC